MVQIDDYIRTAEEEEHFGIDHLRADEAANDAALQAATDRENAASGNPEQ